MSAPRGAHGRREVARAAHAHERDGRPRAHQHVARSGPSTRSPSTLEVTARTRYTPRLRGRGARDPKHGAPGRVGEAVGEHAIALAQLDADAARGEVDHLADAQGHHEGRGAPPSVDAAGRHHDVGGDVRRVEDHADRAHACAAVAPSPA